MATVNDALTALTGLGFEPAGRFLFGSWKDWGLLLQPAGKSVWAVFSVQIPNAPGAGRRALARSLKEKGLKTVTLGGLTKTAATFVLSYGKADNLAAFFTEALNAAAASLRESGIAPPETCAISGAPGPDSFCLTTLNGALGYRPVCAAAVRDQSAQTKEKIEDNQANGSYALGFVGALLGMLVGLIPNLLSIIYTDRIYGILFALVPLASMFGYKLFKGKMSKGSIAIVIVLSLLGVVLIPYLEIVIMLVKDYGAPLNEALAYTLQLFREPDVLSELGGELLQLLLFMALGIWIAWRYMSNLTNSGQALSSETMLATLRPKQ